MPQQLPDKFYKKAFPKNFAIFTSKHLCWRLFLIQNIAKFLRGPILKEHLRTAASKIVHKLGKVKICG